MANRKIIMNILLAGGCGFIGSNLSIFLKKKNFKVVSVDNLSKKHSLLNEKRLKKNKIKNLKIDLLNKKKIEKINFIPDIIIDCAAEPAVEVSARDPSKNVENNFNTSLNLLNLSKKYKSKFIFLSSSRVYSISKSYKLFRNKRKKFYTEDMIDEEPKTIYGFSKYASEMLIIGLSVEALIFLMLGVLGPDKDYYWEKLYPGLSDYESNIAPLTAGDLGEVAKPLNADAVEAIGDGDAKCVF